MTEPRASRPQMPGYGTSSGAEGMLPWSWAEQRLRDSHDYWVSTVWPDGRPHLMPVWGVWDGEHLWFSSSRGSRKIRNVRAGSAVSAATDDAHSPVVLEGVAEIVTEQAVLARFLELVNVKYGTSYGIDMVDPATSASVRVRPRWAFGLDERYFGESPTRWQFGR
ncbi:pyridoxamine 5'-phosphate oxidase family protein [Amycolatopsis nigrescens]|uniref:pyridoxamine 5'-phosphate oxidase family protein n=1 Tax=Amycolatopsis nigrescens TaxID=381445 RepID=UPI0003644CC5|nr:pyridoxamine 5'-phosphate oxidase family protein [Amycolatopsis nigrescens]